MASYAMASGQTKLAKELIKRTPEDKLNETWAGGNTDIIVAAALGDADLVKELEKRGADLTIENEAGVSAANFSTQTNDLQKRALPLIAAVSLGGVGAAAAAPVLAAAAVIGLAWVIGAALTRASGNRSNPEVPTETAPPTSTPTPTTSPYETGPLPTTPPANADEMIRPNDPVLQDMPDEIRTQIFEDMYDSADPWQSMQDMGNMAALYPTFFATLHNPNAQLGRDYRQLTTTVNIATRTFQEEFPQRSRWQFGSQTVDYTRVVPLLGHVPPQERSRLFQHLQNHGNNSET